MNGRVPASPTPVYAGPPADSRHACLVCLASPSREPPDPAHAPHTLGSWAACAAHECSVIGDPMGWFVGHPSWCTNVFRTRLTQPFAPLALLYAGVLRLRLRRQRLAQAPADPVEPRRTPLLLVFPDACGAASHRLSSMVCGIHINSALEGMGSPPTVLPYLLDFHFPGKMKFFAISFAALALAVPAFAQSGAPAASAASSAAAPPASSAAGGGGAPKLPE